MAYLGFRDRSGSITAPLPAQDAFLRSGADFRAYIGGVGSGKSYVGCMEGLRQSFAAPGNVGLIARREYKDLIRTTFETFQRYICPPEIWNRSTWKKQEGKLILPPTRAYAEPSVIYFTHLANESFGSWELGWFYLDEAVEDACEREFEILSEERLRLDIPGVRRCGWLTGNPGGYDYVWKKFVQSNDPNYFIVNANSLENTYLPEDYQARLRRMKVRDPLRARRRVDGLFGAFEGQILPLLREDIHVVDDFPIPDSWKKVSIIDPGWDHPTGIVWMAQDPETKAAYVYRDFKESGWSINGIADEYFKVTTETINSTLIDPASRQTHQTRDRAEGDNTYTMYLDAGIPVWPGNNNWTDSIDRLRDLVEFEENETQTELIFPPQLYFFRGGGWQTWEQMASYRYDPRSQSKPKAMKTEDDLVDCVRMGAMELQFDLPDNRKVDPYVIQDPSIQERCFAQAMRNVKAKQNNGRHKPKPRSRNRKVRRTRNRREVARR